VTVKRQMKRVKFQARLPGCAAYCHSAEFRRSTSVISRAGHAWVDHGVPARIRIALRERRLLNFAYQGHERVVLPMAFGTDKQGNWLLRGQQVGGTSSSGQINSSAPKLWRLVEMNSITVLDTTFSIPVQYRMGDTAFVSIDIQLQHN
jgi:hypothetical protein